MAGVHDAPGQGMVMPSPVQPAIAVAAASSDATAAAVAPPVCVADAGESLMSAHDGVMSDDSSVEEDTADPLLSEEVAPLLQRMAKALGISLPQRHEDTAVVFHLGGLTAPGRADRRSATPFAQDVRDTWAAMDADIAGSYRYPRRLIGSVFRVPDDDYRDILSPPIIDDDVVKRLSSTRSRAAPDSYSPYWEDRVKGVDTRSRELIRLASFQLALLNYVDLLGNGSAHGPDGELDEALKLAAHVTAQQVRASMALSLHCVELRRANAGSTLQRTCGQDLVTAMKKEPRAHASLFGDSFSRYVEVVADKVTKEKVLTDNLVTVSKRKKSK